MYDSRRHVLEVCPEGVIGMPAEFINADFGIVWRVKKDNMEVATGEDS